MACCPVSYIVFPMRSFSRNNLFILNKFLISCKMLITCWELYFEVVGHVNLIIMGYFPENEIFLSNSMSKMTHILNNNKNNCFQTLLQTVLHIKQMIRSRIIFQWYFCENLYKTSDCFHDSNQLSGNMIISQSVATLSYASNRCA